MKDKRILSLTGGHQSLCSTALRGFFFPPAGGLKAEGDVSLNMGYTIIWWWKNRICRGHTLTKYVTQYEMTGSNALDTVAPTIQDIQRARTHKVCQTVRNDRK